ncbi:MAG: hypothetical protein ACTHOO_08720 [Alcanivorax sp.]
MSEAFLKALKWYILCLSVIVGAAAFIISNNTGSIKPVMIGILGFGVAYIMSYFWTEFREKVLFLSIVTFIVLSFISPYVPDAIYILFGHRMGPLYGFTEYYIWAGIVGALGIPTMTAVFYFYD